MSQHRRLDEVLIIDDDPVFQEVVGTFLEEFGPQRVTSADDGRKAIEILGARHDSISLVFCDLHMPAIDGIQVLSHLNRIRFSAPVIIVSGAHDVVLKSAQELAIVYGLDIVAAIPKPVDFEALRQAMDSVVGKMTGAG